MPDRLPIAIIGGGPAGSLLAANLARAGRDVVIFEEKPGWEKPCGGGITHKAMVDWPFLAKASLERNWVHDCELISPQGRRVLFTLEQPIAIFSRKMLNGFLLERARAAGAELRQDRAVRLERRGRGWLVQGQRSSCEAEYVVIAAGARNSFRAQFAETFSPDDLMMTAGYYIPGESQLMQVQFLSGLHGYLWIFPRKGHFSAGICGRLREISTAELRRLLEGTLTELGVKFEGCQFYAHVLPSPRAETLRNSPVSGNGWAMIGDAAGFVDPITGEGLYYAMRSGELLSQALLANAPARYAALVRQELLPELEMAARVAERFYSGSWMGLPVIERMVQFTDHSPSFRSLMCDLFAGTQGYRDLRRRLYVTLPRMLAESLASALRLPYETSPSTADKDRNLIAS